MSGIVYNLIIFHVPEAQSIGDFMTIRNLMARVAPDIDVLIVSPEIAVAPDFWSRTAERPTLLFAPLGPPLARPVDPAIRGARACGQRLGKLAEVELLAKAGILVPRTEKIVPDTKLDEREWGPLVVVKPNTSSGGKGVRLERTKDVRWFDPRIYPRKDPRRGADMLAQQYIDTGPRAWYYRVFTVLGRAIYSNISMSDEEDIVPDVVNSKSIDSKIAPNKGLRTITMSNDEEVISLGETVHRKFPLVPSMGIDIIRERETGRLFVLEINTGGMTWHLSSSLGISQQKMYGVDYYGQFDALQRIADALIEATRKFAV